MKDATSERGYENKRRVAELRTLQSQCQYARVGGGVSGPARASTRSWENFYVKTFPMSSGRRNEVWDSGGGALVVERDGRMKDCYG